MPLFKLARHLLFLLPAETAHHFTLSLLKLGLGLPLVSGYYRNRADKTLFRKEVNVGGLTFKNPIGLAAGFDKNARFFKEMHLLGFGFVEIGTVTPRPQAGNPKPRLFRLKKDEAIINRMGFNNDGVEAIAKRLEDNPFNTIIGGNIGKNKDTSNEQAVDDYLICFRRLHSLVDYFVVNVSSPNTPGLRELQGKESLGLILSALQAENHKIPKPRPIFLKIAPDLSTSQLDDILEIVLENKLSGIISNNTTISREGLKTSDDKVKAMGAGGLSGLPLRDKSQSVLQYLLQNKAPELSIISSGGVTSGEEAEARLRQGASLVQVYSGFVYQGPSLITSFLKRLQKSLP